MSPNYATVIASDSTSRHRPRNRHAALLIDIDDLVRLLRARGFNTPARVIRGITQRLFSYLKHRGVTSVTRVVAIGDFDAAGEGVQRALVLNGVEAVHVPQLEGAPSLGAMQLGIEATALAHSTGEISTVILAVGRLVYLPLVQQLQRSGVRVVLAWDRDQIPGDLVMNVGREGVVSLFEAAPTQRQVDDSPVRRTAGRAGEPSPVQNSEEQVAEITEAPAPRRESEHENGYAHRPPRERRAHHEDEEVDIMPDVRDEPMSGEPVTEANEMAALRTLITSFGRHAEIFLTPYLFKLNTVLPDLERFERKAVVMRLEDAGAVKVERRRGVPNDYSVVIVNYNHPTVRDLLG